MTNLDTQAVRDFKKAVTAAKNRRDMFWRSQAPDLAVMLDQALEQLKQSVSDPQTGVDALIGFYKRDADIFERCDDSYGNVGDVFRMTAADLFVDYAKQCTNKDRVSAQILELQEDDNYGVRDALIDKVSEFLSKSAIRQLIDKIEQHGKNRDTSYLLLKLVKGVTCIDLLFSLNTWRNTMIMEVFRA